MLQNKHTRICCNQYEGQPWLTLINTQIRKNHGKAWNDHNNSIFLHVQIQFLSDI